MRYKPSIKKNVVIMIIYRAFITISPLITTPYICRVLLPSDIGDYAFTQSVVAYFSAISALGVSIYGQREVAYCRDDRDKLSTLFFGLNYCRVFSTSASIFLYLIFVNFIFKQKHFVFFLIQILELATSIFDLSWFYAGIEKFDKVSIRYILLKFLTILLVFIFVKSPVDIYKYVLINSMSIAISNIVFVIGLCKYIHFVHLFNSNFITHIKPILLLFLPTIAGLLYSKVDITMMGFFLDNSEEIAYYQQAMKICIIGETTVGSVGSVFIPRIAHAFSINDKNEFDNYFFKGFDMVSLLIIPISFGIFIISDIFTPLFFGKKYLETILFLKLLAPVSFIAIMKNYLGTQYLFITKRENKYIEYIILGTIFNILLNFLLIQKYNGVGAIFSSFLSEAIIFIFIIYTIYNEIDFLKFFKTLFKKLIAAVIMLLYICILKFNFSISFSSLFFEILSGALLYFFVLYILKDAIVINSILWLFNKLKIKLFKGENNY